MIFIWNTIQNTIFAKEQQLSSSQWCQKVKPLTKPCLQGEEQHGLEIATWNAFECLREIFSENDFSARLNITTFSLYTHPLHWQSILCASLKTKVIKEKCANDIAVLKITVVSSVLRWKHKSFKRGWIVSLYSKLHFYMF